MPELIRSPLSITSARQRAILPNRLVENRTHRFGCVNLRRSQKSPLGILMDSQERRTGARNATLANAPDFSGRFFLRTKLLPPRPAPEILARPRLIERLQANLALPMTLVTANAGSGKTTLVADFLRKQERPYVWYQLDHTDAGPTVFLCYLTYCIQQRIDNFGETMFAYLQQSQELAQQPKLAADVLLNEILEGVEQQMILVLDDYHHLGVETPFHPVPDRLIAYLPDVLHVIVISRDIPPLTLSRLRSQDSLAIIYRTDLLFTD